MAANAESLHARHVLDVVQGLRPPAGMATDPSIARSWRRCLEQHALDPAQARAPSVLESARLRARRETLARLCDVSAPALRSLQRQLNNASQAVLLTDAQGVVLDCLAHADQRRGFNRAGLWPGADWSEGCEGTNGIGTCVVERQPVIIYQDEHFRSRHTPLTCTASPVFDPAGELLAVLDVSSARTDLTRQSQFHTLALVNLSAKRIEAGYFLHEFAHRWLLQLQDPLDPVGGLAQGLVAFDDDGRVCALDQGAMNLLGRTRDGVVGQSVEGLFALSLAELQDKACPQPLTSWPIRTQTGALLHGLLRSPGSAPSTKPRRQSPQARRSGFNPTAPFGDARIEESLRRACRVHARDIPLLIAGETGTGKDVFARAVHELSERAAKPFIALNCAAIPESLIESELFGYRGGSFTGARREGVVGKLREADGGTLFLDEVGDMPIALQTRLLRALEERCVVPLGGGAPQPLDIRLISATHQDLASQVRAGMFREDLYYRINGFRVVLPPLRERADRAALLERLLTEEAGDQPVRLAEEVRERLLAYSWPGNVRQMRVVLRALVALCEDGLVRFRELPDELRAVDDAAAASKPLGAAERHALLEALECQHWHMSAAAAQLGLSRSTFYRKLKQHGIRRGP